MPAERIDLLRPCSSMGLLRGRVIGNGAGIILSSDEPDYSDSLAQQGAEERGVVRLLRAESGM